MTRREAREQALAMIFEMNFNDNTVGEMVDNALIFRDETSSTVRSGKPTACQRYRWRY